MAQKKLSRILLIAHYIVWMNFRHFWIRFPNVVVFSWSKCLGVTTVIFYEDNFWRPAPLLEDNFSCSCFFWSYWDRLLRYIFTIIRSFPNQLVMFVSQISECLYCYFLIFEVINIIILFCLCLWPEYHVPCSLHGYVSNSLTENITKNITKWCIDMVIWTYRGSEENMFC